LGMWQAFGRIENKSRTSLNSTPIKWTATITPTTNKQEEQQHQELQIAAST